MKAYDVTSTEDADAIRTNGFLEVGKMTKIIAIVVSAAIVGCGAIVFAPPKVLYSNEGTIGVRYRSAGIQSLDEANKAMQLISSHCSGKYEVTNRIEETGWTTVDARCSR